MKQVENNENKGKASEEWKRMRRVENGWAESGEGWGEV